jgi:hypothetical protein
MRVILINPTSMPRHFAQPISSSKKEIKMNLNKPKVITWWIAVVLAVLGVIANLVTIPVLSGFAFWLVVIAFVLLAAANALKGL